VVDFIAIAIARMAVMFSIPFGLLLRGMVESCD